MNEERLVRAVYLIAMLMIVHSAIDLLANIWPPNLGAPGWRYGAAGFLSQYALSMVFGLVVLGVAAWWNQNPTVLRVLVVVAVLGALLLGLGLVSFALDVVQVRGMVLPDGLATFKTGAIKAAFKLGSLAAFLLYLALAFRQASRSSVPGTLEMASPGDLDWRPDGGPATPDTV